MLIKFWDKLPLLKKIQLLHEKCMTCPSKLSNILARCQGDIHYLQR